jgi:hypothetical protein
MTHRLRRHAQALLSPKRLFQVGELRACPSLIPAEPGIYGWWFSKELRGVPIDGTHRQGRWRLLYVGIAPSRPTSARRPRTLRSRLKDHCRGPAAKSTLRRTLACLFQTELQLCIERRPLGKVWMSPEDEARLTSWMDTNARVAWLCHNQPWTLEEELIKRDQPRLPLNIKGSSHSFRAELKELRRVAGRNCVRELNT